MTARRWGALAAAVMAAAVVVVVLWPGGSAPVSRGATAHVSGERLASCRSARPARCGALSVGSRYIGGLPTEGAIVTLTLTRAHISLALQRIQGGVGRVRTPLPAGRVTLGGAVHICDANCGHLDPPVLCAPAPVRIVAHRVTRATVVIGAPTRCRVVVTG